MKQVKAPKPVAVTPVTPLMVAVRALQIIKSEAFGISNLAQAERVAILALDIVEGRPEEALRYATSRGLLDVHAGLTGEG